MIKMRWQVEEMIIHNVHGKMREKEKKMNK
jgi:hypothetical protein